MREIPQLFDRVAAMVLRFSKGHEDETFYGFAFDDDNLCLASEETYRALVEEEGERWEREMHAPVTEASLSDADRYIIREKGLSVEWFIKKREEKLVKLRRIGNPYRDERFLAYFRWAPNRWKYWGFDNLSNEVPRELMVGHELGDIGEMRFKEHQYPDQVGFWDDYDERNKLVELLEKHRDEVFSCLRTTSDLRIFKVVRDPFW